MTITIQLNTAEEWQVMEQVLMLFKQHRLDFNINQTGAKRPKKKLVQKTPGLAASLYGIVQLPENFDYKAFMADELLKKYGLNG